jgi:DNA polymerase I-like protein with 3'-5' exonuclease and polymerase domains
MYGMGLHAAALKLQISHQVAQSIVTSFYQKFKGVKAWIEYIKRYEMKHAAVCLLPI